MTDTPDTPEAETPEPEPERVPDPVRDPLLEQIQAAIGDDVVGGVVEKGDIWIRVDRSAWRRTAQYLKDHGFTYFCFLSGIDWQPNAELSNRYEQVFTADTPTEATGDEAPVPDVTSTEIQTGVAGGDTRFQMLARFYDVDARIGITVKADLDADNPSVDSLVPVYRGADWHERETWEMFGFDFVGHPGLRHLYLPTEFEGFPLRKDFPLLARVVKPWPGLVDKEPVPGEDDDEPAEAATS